MAATPKRVAAISLMGDIFVSHHFRKQRLLPARRLFAFPNKDFHQSSLKGELAAEYVGVRFSVIASHARYHKCHEGIELPLI
jgi:hypothetical protein